METRDRRQLTAFVVPKTTGQRGSFSPGVFSCTCADGGRAAVFLSAFCLPLSGPGGARRFIFPNDGNAIAAQARQILFGVHLLWFGFFLFSLFRGVARGFFFLRWLRLHLR